MMAPLTLQEEEILCEKLKRYPVLFDKQLKGYKQKDVVANSWIAVPKEIETGRFLLLSYKNNEKRWIESEAQLEPCQTCTMNLF